MNECDTIFALLALLDRNKENDRSNKAYYSLASSREQSSAHSPLI